MCALLTADPERAKEQILRAAARQYEEGDVQHWWHEESASGAGKGVRPRYSDALLWLPYTICAYVDKTGDEEILEVPAPYLKSPPLREEEHERYEAAPPSQKRESVLEHALKAAELVLERGTGAHGLALFGGGDWNDGMNLVGAGGRGESVWLTWFAAHVFASLAELLEERDGREDRVRLLRENSARWAAAANEAWCGAWFLRGYYDDGTSLGGCGDRSCEIDSVAQSFGALWSLADPEKARRALESAVGRLYSREDRLVCLLTPPFCGEGPNPGYIGSYPPGIRENGGQYTHAAVWLAMACLRTGMAEEGYALLRALLPGGRDERRYRVEPYVLAADVYSHPQHRGRGGWSWYTGAAGWYYQAAVEDLLGIVLRRGVLRIKPRLPADWPAYEAVFRTEQQSSVSKSARGKRDALPGRRARGGGRGSIHAGRRTRTGGNCAAERRNSGDGILNFL